MPRWATELVSTYDRVLSELFWFLVALAVVYALGRVVVDPQSAIYKRAAVDVAVLSASPQSAIYK